MARSSKSKGSVIHIHDYLSRRVQSVQEEIREIERLTALLMNQLINEKDHAIARRLQQEVGRLDTQLSNLQNLLKLEQKRQLRYAQS